METKTTPPKTTPTPAHASDVWPGEVAGLLGEVQKMLDGGKASDALERLERAGLNSPWLVNAAAVCQLRLGDVKGALSSLRVLVLAGLFLRGDVPTVFKINYATALLADGNLSGGLRMLSEARADGHPACEETRASVSRWQAGMTFLQWLWWSLGGAPPRPYAPDFPAGRLR